MHSGARCKSSQPCAESRGMASQRGAAGHHCSPDSAAIAGGRRRPQGTFLRVLLQSPNLCLRRGTKLVRPETSGSVSVNLLPRHIGAARVRPAVPWRSQRNPLVRQPCADLCSL